MKFAYFYASSPEVAYPEILSLGPLPAITIVAADNLPGKILVALNTAVFGISTELDFSLDVDIFFKGEKVKSDIETYDPFRKVISAYLPDESLARYSFQDIFTANEPGVYTFIARLYNGPTPQTDEGKLNFVHQTECSIIIVKGGDRHGFSS